MIASRRSLLLLGCLAYTQAAPIFCGDTVTDLILPFGSTSYEFTATTAGVMVPWTCDSTTSSDTKITVTAGGSVVAESDDLGVVVCPSNPKASGVTVHVSVGVTYTIEVSGGAAWSVGDDSAYSLDLICNGLMESYWETMFNNSGYDYSLFDVINGVWYYNGDSTCVGKGNYWGICPFHHVHCSGDSTYGWGSAQAMDVLEALGELDGKYPGYSNGCPVDLTCTNAQYTCVNQNCIDLDQLCDGTNDCTGAAGSDDEDPSMTNGLCGVECNAHAQCQSGEYCNNQNMCISPCGDCDTLQDPVDGTCPDCSGVCSVLGCMDPLALNYDDAADCDDGSCESCSSNGTGIPGPSLHLVTDFPSGLNAGKCGLASNGDLELSCHTSQKYPTSIISLLSPLTGAQPFSTSFSEQGRTATTSPAFWTHSQGPVCDNTYDGVFTWSDLLTGDDSTVLIRADFSDAVMFTGWIAVDMFEQLESLRDVNLTRWVRQKLPFRIKFNTDVTAMSSNIKVHDEWNTFFAIIEQKTIVVDSEASPPKIEADIVLWASVEYPFRLTETGVQVNVAALDNPGLSVVLLEDCMPAVGEPCFQKFLIHVDLENECFFSGQYTVDFEVECLPAVQVAQCPLNSSVHTASVDFDIETENVCPTMILNVIATGSVTSHQTARIGDAPYTAPEHFAFMVNSWAFFEVTMESVDGLIVETTITRIDLCFQVGCTNPTLLYDNGAAQVAELQLNVLDYPRDPTVSPLPQNSDIHMYLSGDVFDAPPDGCLDFFLMIEVKVEYFHTSALLEEGQERDMKMISAEALRSTPKARKMLLDVDAVADTTSVTTTVSAGVTSEVVVPGQSVGETDDTPIEETGSASTISTTMLGSFLAVVIAIAQW